MQNQNAKYVNLLLVFYFFNLKKNIIKKDFDFYRDDDLTDFKTKSGWQARKVLKIFRENNLNIVIKWSQKIKGA